MKKDSPLYKLIKESAEPESSPKSFRRPDVIISLIIGILISALIVGFMLWIALSKHWLAQSISKTLEGISF